MGFLQDNAAVAAPNPNAALDQNFDAAFSGGQSPPVAPPPLQIDQSGQGAPIAVNPSEATAAIPDSAGSVDPHQGFFQKLLADVAPGGTGVNSSPGTGTGGRRSLMDIIGGIGDAFAQAGGAPVQYGPGIDARVARAQTATNNGFQNTFNQQAVEKGNIDLANQRTAQIGQVSAGLNSLYGDGSPENVAKVQQALPLFAKTLGVDPSTPQYQALQQGLQTDPHGTISMMQHALGKTQKDTSAQAQMYQLLKANAPDLAPKYLDHIVNGMPLSEKDQLQLSLQTKKLGNDTRKTDAYVAANTPITAGGTGGAGGLSDTALNYAADNYRQTGQLPPLGQGKAAAGLRAAIVERASQRAQGGGDAANPAAFRAGFKANAGALNKITTQIAQTEPRLAAASDNADQVLKLLPTGVAGQSPIINRWIQAGRRSITGDPEVTRFDTGIKTFAREYAAVVSMANGGRVTDTAQRHVDELINGNMNAPQIRASIAQMQTDMGNVMTEYHNQAKSISGQLNLPANTKPSVISGASKTATGPNGQKAFLVGGKWVDATGKAL